jgi:ubiquinone/menaquinone biosynthesis C-methylase UbiE
VSTPHADPSHYSYTVYADADMAASFDAARFGGPIGGLLAETQERVLLDFASPVGGRSFLDVGTGTGRAAMALARNGGTVTGVDASREMLEAGAARARQAGANVTFELGDAHALAFPEGAFDVCVSFRVLMHTPGWRQCVAELCRVARTHVILDYPAAASAAALQAGWRRAAHAAGRRVEAYRVFTQATMTATLAEHGFRVVRVHRQFVLPIGLHKAIGSRAFTERLEGGLARLGLLWLAGSPVTLLAERCGSS